MENYAILMFIFAGILFFYAALLAATRNVNLIPRSSMAQIKDKKRYAGRVANILALTALAPFLSALLARRTGSAALALVILIGGGAAMIWVGIKITSETK